MECTQIWLVQTPDKVTALNLGLWHKCWCTNNCCSRLQSTIPQWISHSIKYLLIVSGFSSWLLEPWDTQHLLPVGGHRHAPDIDQSEASIQVTWSVWTNQRPQPLQTSGGANVTSRKKTLIVMQMANDFSYCLAWLALKAHTFPSICRWAWRMKLNSVRLILTLDQHYILFGLSRCRVRAQGEEWRWPGPWLPLTRVTGPCTAQWDSRCYMP